MISKCCSHLHAGTQKYLLNLNKIDKKKGASPRQTQLVPLTKTKIGAIFQEFQEKTIWPFFCLFKALVCSQ